MGLGLRPTSCLLGTGGMSGIFYFSLSRLILIELAKGSLQRQGILIPSKWVRGWVLVCGLPTWVADHLAEGKEASLSKL